MRALVLAVVLWICGCGADSRTARPNLLFVSIDTLRADALSCYGNPRETTPAIDAFASTATRFTDAWATSPKTAPSHMTMLTGLPSRVHGVGNLDTAGASRLGPQVEPLAEILSRAGYATGAFTDGGNARGTLGFDRGFEDFDDKKAALAQKLPRIDGWVTEAVAEGRPWFLFLHTYDVHDPYYASPEARAKVLSPDYEGRIVADRAELNRLVADGEDLAPNATGHKKMMANFWRRAVLNDPADLGRLHELYLACVVDVDTALGALLSSLEERGLLDNTLVVITSDHGEEFGEHGMTRHDQLWREVLHVPLIVRSPGGVGAGAVIDARVSHVDLVPSILEALDVADRSDARLGSSWAGWLEDGARAEPRAAYAEHRSRTDRDLDLWTLRDGDWLLHEDRDGRVLVDLAADPYELSTATDADREDALLNRRREILARYLPLAERLATGDGIPIDPAIRAELEALGYLGGED